MKTKIFIISGILLNCVIWFGAGYNVRGIEYPKHDYLMEMDTVHMTLYDGSRLVGYLDYAKNKQLDSLLRVDNE